MPLSNAASERRPCRRNRRLSMDRHLDRRHEPKVEQISSYLVEHRMTGLCVQGGQEPLEQTGTATSLRRLELLEAPEKHVRPEGLFAAVAHVFVCIVAPAVGTAPRTKTTWAARALQCEAADKVEECLATPRALEREDFLHDVIAHCADAPLLFVQRLQATKLGVEPRLHLTFELGRLALFEKVQAGLRISPEDNGAQVLREVRVWVGRGVARSAWATHPALRCLAQPELGVAAVIHMLLQAWPADEVLIAAVAASTLQAILKGNVVVQANATKAALVPGPSEGRGEERILQDLLCDRPRKWVQRLHALEQSVALWARGRHFLYCRAQGEDVRSWGRAGAQELWGCEARGETNRGHRGLRTGS
mmetsp:Transcript_8960/g.23327  ORF Transcript_8960/g.23327 Transcript_8960/m.23327 type:complete len:363 (-) Transcript_8960:2838-3926(-)